MEGAEFLWDEMRFLEGWEHWLIQSGNLLSFTHRLSRSSFLGCLNPAGLEGLLLVVLSFLDIVIGLAYRVRSSLSQVIFCWGFMSCHLWIFSSLFQVSSLYFPRVSALSILALTHRFPLWVAGWPLFIIPIQMNSNVIDSQDKANHSEDQTFSFRNEIQQENQKKNKQQKTHNCSLLLIILLCRIPSFIVRCIPFSLSDAELGYCFVSCF